MEEHVKLNNEHINAILTASYALTNKMGSWFQGPETKSDEVVLTALAAVQNEMKALFDACPDLSDRAHSPAEIQAIVTAGLNLIGALGAAFSSAAQIPDVMREEVKNLYRALNSAGLIDSGG